MLEGLAAYLRSRQTLLLLDNFEHLRDAASQIQHLLQSAPGLVVLVTSREPLRLRAEREFPVDPLPLPVADTGISVEDALDAPAVRLFVERAQALKPAFALDESNVADVVAICRRLDGLPLAIELAAARVRILTPAALLARLDQRLSILTGGARDLPERQQTLRAAIAWSYDLLVPPERALFARLAVFAGGCTLEAAEAVCSAGGGLPLDLLDGIDSLVQKSLLRQEEGPGGEPRFTMLETIREFAQERLHELPEANALRQAHADTLLALAETVDQEDVSGEVDLLNRLEADHANFRQAIAYYTSQGAAGLAKRVRLVAALAHFWRTHGHLAEGRRELEEAIAAEGDIPPAQCAPAIKGAALLAEAQGDLDGAERLNEQVLALLRETGDMAGVADALTGLGVIARQRGDLKTARSRHQEALDAWRRAGDAAGTAGALLDLGLIRQLEGDYVGAEPAFKESLGLFRRLGDDLGEAHALHYLGVLAMATASLPEAIEWFGESLRLWHAMSNRQMIATDFANLGEAHYLSGSLDEAERLYQEALTLFEALGDPRGRGLRHGPGRSARTRSWESAGGPRAAARKPAAPLGCRTAWVGGRCAPGAGRSDLAPGRAGRRRYATPDGQPLAGGDRPRAPAGLRGALPAGSGRRQRPQTCGVPRHRSDGGYGNPATGYRRPCTRIGVVAAQATTQRIAGRLWGQPRGSSEGRFADPGLDSGNKTRTFSSARLRRRLSCL